MFIYCSVIQNSTEATICVCYVCFYYTLVKIDESLAKFSVSSSMVCETLRYSLQTYNLKDY